MIGESVDSIMKQAVYDFSDLGTNFGGFGTEDELEAVLLNEEAAPSSPEPEPMLLVVPPKLAAAIRFEAAFDGDMTPEQLALKTLAEASRAFLEDLVPSHSDGRLEAVLTAGEGVAK